MSDPARVALSSDTELPAGEARRAPAGAGVGSHELREAGSGDLAVMAVPLPVPPWFQRTMREGRALQAMLAALVAWTITVAPAAFARGVPLSARIVAALAVVCGMAAPPLSLSRRRAARHLGISA